MSYQAHFDIPGATDVMTFPDGSIDPENGTTHLGDIAIGAEVAVAVVDGRTTPPTNRDRAIADELVLYGLHGLLHLLGYDDENPDDLQEMWQRQRELLALVEIELESEPTA